MNISIYLFIILYIILYRNTDDVTKTFHPLVSNFLRNNNPQISRELLSLEEEYTDILLTITSLLLLESSNEIKIQSADTLFYIVTHLPTLLWTYIILIIFIIFK